MKTVMIRIQLPFHLRTLAHIEGEVSLTVESPVTISALLDALETAHPVLRGTIRDHETQKRRPFLRFYACEKDLSNEPSGARLPPEVESGEKPFLIIGAIAGG